LVVLASAQPKRQFRPPSTETKAKKTEELQDLIAQQIQRQIGVQVRIKDLVYNLFTSTFTGTGIEAGPRKAPLLRIPKIQVKVELLSESGVDRTIAKIDIVGPHATLDTTKLEKTMGGNYQSVHIRHLRIAKGKLTLRFAAGRLTLTGIDGYLKGFRALRWPSKGRPDLAGDLRMTVDSVSWSKQPLGKLLLTGRLNKDKLLLESFVLNGPDYQARLNGTASFGRWGTLLGAIQLSGTVQLNLGPQIQTAKGKIRVEGKTPRQLKLFGTLKTSSHKLPSRGGIKTAPSLYLRLRINNKRLRGTLKRWRLR
jgi:hypothetical protein